MSLRGAAAAWVTVALLMQAMFPVFALATVAREAPFFDATICNAHPEGQGTPAPKSQASAACAACCIAPIAAALVPSAPEPASSFEYVAAEAPSCPLVAIFSHSVFTPSQPRAPPPAA
jgi:hypothetical protein